LASDWKTCSHDLIFIAKISREVQMDEFVHEYFSVDRCKKAYASKFNSMTSKDQWPHVNLGYKINKPKLRRKPGRPKNLGSRHLMKLALARKERCVRNAMN
jgi:hypothetical protein